MIWISIVYHLVLYILEYYSSHIFLLFQLWLMYYSIINIFSFITFLFISWILVQNMYIFCIYVYIYTIIIYHIWYVNNIHIYIYILPIFIIFSYKHINILHMLAKSYYQCLLSIHKMLYHYFDIRIKNLI